MRHRSGKLFTDYTFGLWDRNAGERGEPAQLVSFAKAYSGKGLIEPDLDYVSCHTCGYRTRKPHLSLSGVYQGALRRNVFSGIQPNTAAWLSEVWDSQRVVLGTVQ